MNEGPAVVAPDRWDQMVTVGRVARPHGLRGQVIVNTDTDFPDERFRPGGSLWIQQGDGTERLEIAEVRFQRGRPVLTLGGIDSVEEAQRLAGHELRVPDGALVPLPEGTYYRHHLIGCQVQTAGGDSVGLVADVEGSLEQSRLVIPGPRGEILVPLAASICLEIDPAARRIVIDPPEGLLDLNVTRRSVRESSA